MPDQGFSPRPSRDDTVVPSDWRLQSLNAHSPSQSPQTLSPVDNRPTSLLAGWDPAHLSIIDSSEYEDEKTEYDISTSRPTSLLPVLSRSALSVPSRSTFNPRTSSFDLREDSTSVLSQKSKDETWLHEPERAHSQQADLGLDDERDMDLVFGERPVYRQWAETQLDLVQRTKRLRRPMWFQHTFQYFVYALELAAVYLILVGKPLWDGVIYAFWKVYHSHFFVVAGVAIFIGTDLLFACAPILTTTYEPAPPSDDPDWHVHNAARTAETALIIPCYKSAGIIGTTLEAALRTFPARNIFVVNNGNFAAPVDNTEEVCTSYGVRHIWVPIGSKITAQYIGCAAAFEFKYALLIDDDVILPFPFPVVTDRIELGELDGLVKCIGYTISSCGPEGARGNFCQVAQDIEYKLSGLMRQFLGIWSSSNFPHGAICLWEQAFLAECFRKHPGYTISEDWFFGYICRIMGGRIKMCSEVFVKTETPAHLLNGRVKGERAGYGELTVTKQRFRWNMLLVSRTWHNIRYIVFAWRLREYDLLIKLWIFREMYQTAMMVSAPVLLPAILATHPQFSIPISFGASGAYALLLTIFNEYHLRRRGQMVSRRVLYFYYPLYKIYLAFVNIWSCYRSMYRYARFFRAKQVKVIENAKVMQVIVDLYKKRYSVKV